MPLFSPEALQQAIRNTPPAEVGPEVAGQQLPSMATTPNSSKTSWAPPGPLDRGAIAALLGGQALDTGSSLHNFSRGLAEQNPLYTWMGQQPSAGLVAMKGLQTYLALRAMHKLNESGHPTIAKVVGYAGGAAGAIPGIYNLLQPTPK